MIRVMIAASHEEVREGLRTVLTLAGNIEIMEGFKDLALHPRDCPDAAIVDMEMPGGEGSDAIRRIKTRCPCARVIALTAHDYPAAREEALQAGASVVMLKGLSIPEMVAVIWQAVGKADA